MKRLVLLPLLIALGCTSGGPAPSHHPDDPDAARPTLAKDTYYSGIVSPYTSPEGCRAAAPNPIECHLEVALCAGGVAGFSNFDLPQQGTYYLEGSVAVVTVANGAGSVVMSLDTQSGAATNAQTDTYILDTVGRWNTLEDDAGVHCPDAP